MQLEEGLSTCEVLNSIQKFPNVWKAIFQPSDEFKLNADKFLGEVVVEYNNSQTLREKEIVTFKLFCNVIICFMMRVRVELLSTHSTVAECTVHDFKRNLIGFIVLINLQTV